MRRMAGKVARAITRDFKQRGRIKTLQEKLRNIDLTSFTPQERRALACLERISYNRGEKFNMEPSFQLLENKFKQLEKKKAGGVRVWFDHPVR